MKRIPRLATGALAILALITASGCDFLNAPSDQPDATLEALTDLPPAGDGTSDGSLGEPDGAPAPAEVAFPNDRFVDAKKKNLATMDELSF